MYWDFIQTKHWEFRKQLIFATFAKCILSLQQTWRKIDWNVSTPLLFTEIGDHMASVGYRQVTWVGIITNAQLMLEPSEIYQILFLCIHYGLLDSYFFQGASISHSKFPWVSESPGKPTELNFKDSGCDHEVLGVLESKNLKTRPNLTQKANFQTVFGS